MAGATFGPLLLFLNNKANSGSRISTQRLFLRLSVFEKKTGCVLIVLTLLVPPSLRPPFPSPHPSLYGVGAPVLCVHVTPWPSYQGVKNHPLKHDICVTPLESITDRKTLSSLSFLCCYATSCKRCREPGGFSFDPETCAASTL